MTGRVQSLRSAVAGSRPTGRQPGELYVNFADLQLGVINAASAAQDLVAVPFFSTTSAYVVGQFVVQAGQLYRCVTATGPSAFAPANWTQITAVADLSAIYLPLAGGTMAGPLVLAANPTVATQAANKSYVDAGDATKLSLAGGTMTGPIVLPGNPTTPLQTVPKQYVDALPVAMNDNRLINGDMRIDQRNAGASGTASGLYTLDRWYFGNVASLGTWGQNLNSAGGPPGFPYCWGFQSSSAHTPAAGDVMTLSQSIEADMISDFAWGTANAQPVTLSFWALSLTVTGTFSGSIRNYAGTRSYPFTFSLPTAAVWTKITITIPGDTAGAWVMSGSAGSLILGFDLGCGSTYRGPANAWANGNFCGATGSVSIVSTTSAQIFFTGVKLEIGSVATPYNRQSLAKSLADCQRYYLLTGVLVGGNTAAGGQAYSSVYYKVPMRVFPTGVLSNPAYYNASGLMTAGVGDTTYIVWLVTITAAGYGYGDGTLAFSAEL
jgi:hypothetical protein